MMNAKHFHRHADECTTNNSYRFIWECMVQPFECNHENKLGCEWDRNELKKIIFFRCRWHGSEGAFCWWHTTLLLIAFGPIHEIEYVWQRHLVPFFTFFTPKNTHKKWYRNAVALYILRALCLVRRFNSVTAILVFIVRMYTRWINNRIEFFF